MNLGHLGIPQAGDVMRLIILIIAVMLLWLAFGPCAAIGLGLISWVLM
jgi:hypothetical protein